MIIKRVYQFSRGALLTLIILFCVKSYAFLQNNSQTPNVNENPADTSTIATDFRLPVTATSKQQSLDGKKKTSIFIENVVIRQGSLEILAERVEANAAAGQGKEIISASGSPASYSQRLEDGSMVFASANKIIYTVESLTISLRGNAPLFKTMFK